MTVAPARWRRACRLLAVTSCLSMLAAGCGARLSKQQFDAATSGGSGTGAGAGTVGGVSAGDQTASTEPGGAAATPGGATATTVTGGGTQAGAPVKGATATTAKAGGAQAAATGGGATATTAAPGDNGGATDTGVTANSITVANISTITGPVPGLFAGAVNGTQAFFAYQNSLGGVNGRQLKLQVADDRFDCGTNRSLTDQYAGSVFGFVGSFSLFDGCGAPIITGKPQISDVHNALSLDAQKEPNNFSAAPVKAGLSLGVINWIKSKYPNSIGAVGSLVGDVQASRDSWNGAQKVMEANGFHFAYTRLYEPTETDFTADIVQMRSKGVKLVIEISADAKTAARLETAAQQQGWKPDAWIGGASLYDSQFLPLAGAAAEGTLIYNSTAMYLGEDSALVPEVALFQTWMKKTHPGAAVDLFTAYGWLSARMFVDGLKAAGPKVTRVALQQALQKVHSFEGNGMMAKTDPAGKGPASCFMMIQVKGGQYSRLEPANGFECNGDYVAA